MGTEKIRQIRKIVEEEHHKEDFNYHICSVVDNAMRLARKLGADLEVVEISALLHDIGRTHPKKEDFNPENDHHLVGEKQSKIILKELGFEDDLIERVAHCVLAHRGRKGPDPETIEAKIVNCADAMAHFDTFLNLFKTILKRTDSFEEAVDKIAGKVERNWNKKLSLPEAKEIVEEKYKAIKLLINSMKENMRK